MGKFGQLVYDLTGSGGFEVGPGMRCQTWSIEEPVPTQWAENLPTCPCTRSQALEDLSFMQDTMDTGARVKTLRGQRWGGTGGHVFQSVLSNNHGSEKRCVYELDGPLLAGYSERYFSGHNIEKHIGMWFKLEDNSNICYRGMLFHYYFILLKIISCIGSKRVSQLEK